MTTRADVAVVSQYLARALARHGALVELGADGQVDAVLPAALQPHLGVPEAATLRMFGPVHEGETLLPIESAGLTWCLDQSDRAGRVAAARLAVPASHRADLGSAVAAQATALNGVVRSEGSAPWTVQTHLCEFRGEAIGEERFETTILVAVEPQTGAVSADLAEALDARSDAMVAAEMPTPRAQLVQTAERAVATARALLAARLGPFRARLLGRMTADATRLVDYHERLLVEARRRRTAEPQALADKIAAIERQKDSKLGEIRERFTLTVRLSLASVLVVRYEAQVCDLTFRRKKLELPLRVIWDPVLRVPLAPPCPACRVGSLARHACDEAGHLTCAACAAPCATCGRVTCRVCRPTGCRGCG